MCWAVIYSTRQTVKRGIGSASAIVATACSVSLALGFLFFFVVLANPGPVLKGIHTDLTGAMVVGAVTMGITAVISVCAALICIVRRVAGWAKVFFLLAVACAFQGCTMFYILFLH